MSRNVGIERATRAIRHLVQHCGGQRTAGLLLVCTLAAAAHLACNGDSPTAPALPPSPPPPPATAFTYRNAWYTVLLQPLNAGREYPRGAQLQIDGRTIWNGAVEPPFCCDYYGYDVITNMVVSDHAPLAPGRHTLTLRITDQERSPSAYRLSGWADVVFENNRESRAQRVVSWQDVTARMRTGQDWSIEFEVPAPPSS